MKKRVGKIIFLVAALLVLALITYTRWPVSLGKIIDADPSSVDDLSAYSTIAGVENGVPYINTTVLPYQRQEKNETHLTVVMDLLDGTKYRPSLRNLLPWPQYIENLNDYDGTCVWVQLIIGEDSRHLVFYGKYVGIENDRGDFTLYHSVDNTVRQQLLDYVAAYGWSDGVSAEELWTEEEILSLFSKIEYDDCQVLDCVPVTDGAYDMVGVVLYWNAEEETTYIAFLDEEGNSQEAGVVARAVDPPELSYVGGGTVVFLLQKEDGSTTNYALSISVKDENIYFKAVEGSMLLLS